MHPATSPRRRSNRGRWRLAAVSLLLSAGVLSQATPATAAPGAAAAAAAPVPTAITLRNVSGGAVQVSWSSAADAHRWRVVVVADGRFLGQRNFAGEARTGRIGSIPPGTSVAVGIGAITPSGDWETWATSATVKAPRDPSCPVVTLGTCVHVDARTTTQAVSGVGLGFLHGITNATDASRVGSLDVRHWRISATDEERFRAARAAGGSITVVLSDPWMWHMTMPDGRAYSPWTNFDFYRWWVSTIAQWHADRGLIPDRWEIQNEPLASSFDPANPPTQDTIVEQHAVATEGIRSVLPDADIVGPSFYPFESGSGVVDFEAFAHKAAERGLDLDAVAWHEISGACGGCDGGPSSVRQHIDDARAALSAAGLGSVPIDITEYGATYEQLQPGAIVGYLSALSDGGVRFGGASCWERGDGLGSGCFAPEGTLTGLLMRDSRTPTDAWWAYEAYAKLSAGGRLTRTTVDDPTTSAVASVDGKVVRALIGRHQGCTLADLPCPLGATAGVPELVNVRTSLPSTGRWTVVVTRLASTAGASSGPKVVSSRTINVTTTGTTNLGSFLVADGEVLQVVATAGDPLRTRNSARW